MYTAKTIREAVTLATEKGFDTWEFELAEGPLFDAAWRNRGTANQHAAISDYGRMRMCAFYGRHWCV